MKTNNRLLNNFILSLKSKGRSKNTIIAYENDVIQLLQYLNQNKNNNDDIYSLDQDFFQSVSYQDLEFYSNHLTQIGDSESTRARKITSIREFFKYLMKVKATTINPAFDLEIPKIPERNPTFLNVQESKKMLNGIDEYDSCNKERDYAIVTLLLNLGLRVSELIGINISDIKDNRVRIIRKGNEEKYLPLNDTCINAINTYLTIRPKVNDDALFLSTKNKRISVKAVRYLTHKYGNINPHALRHSCFTNLLNTGKVNIRQVQELANHKNIVTTSRYTHITNEEMKATVAANPYD